MTLGEIKRNIRVRLRQHLNTDAGGDPFTLQTDILEAADKVAGLTDGLFDYQTVALTDGTSHYCASDYYRITGLSVKNSSDKWSPLWLFDDPGAADERMCGFWRDTTQEADPPQIAVFNGVNSFTLYPTPSTTRANALRIDGWRKPGEFWVYTDGAGVALADSQECPLPAYAHRAVYLEALAQQALFDSRPEIRGLYDELRRQADVETEDVEAKNALHHNHAAYRANPYESYDNRVGLYGRFR